MIIISNMINVIVPLWQVIVVIAMSVLLISTIIAVIVIKVKDRQDHDEQEYLMRLESERYRRENETERLDSMRHSRDTNIDRINGMQEDPLIKIESDRQKRMQETMRITSNQTERDNRAMLDSDSHKRKTDTLMLADTVENREEILLLPKAKKPRKPRTTKPKTDKVTGEVKPKAPRKPRTPKVKIDKTEKDIDTIIQQLIDQIVNFDIKHPEDKKQKLEFITPKQAKKAVPNKIAKRVVHGNKKSKRCKMVVLNIGMLNSNFKNGDTVDIDILKEKGILPVNALGYKVLANGVLDKSLHIKANQFSTDAVKMLVLTGGKATKV